MEIALVFPTKSISQVSIPLLQSLRNELQGCNTSQFESVAAPCFNHLVKIIQSYSPTKLINYTACKVLVDILTMSSNQPLLNREFSTNHVPSLLSVLMNQIENGIYHGLLILLETVLQYYSGCVTHHAGKIEKLILNKVDCATSSIDLKILAQNFAYLPFIGQNSKREMRWSEFYNKTCGCLVQYINHYFDLLGLSCDIDSVKCNKKFPFPNFSNKDENNGLSVYKKRFEFIIYCLSAVLLNGSSTPLKIDFSLIIRCFDVFLSINSAKLIKTGSQNQAKVSSNIVILQIYFNRLVQLMYETIETNSFVFNNETLTAILRQLNWTKPSARLPHIEDEFSNYRHELYNTVHSILVNSAELCYGVIFLNRVSLIEHLLHDVEILFDAQSRNLTAQSSVESTKACPTANKIRKSVYSTSRKKLKNNQRASVDLDVSNECLTNVKVSPLAYVDTTIMAWKVLGNLLPILFNNNHYFDIISANSMTNLWQKICRKLQSILSVLSMSSLESISPYANNDVLSEFVQFLEHYLIIQQRNICPISFSITRSFLSNCAMQHFDINLRIQAKNSLTRLDAILGSWTPRLGRYQSNFSSPCLSNIIAESNSNCDGNIHESNGTNTEKGRNIVDGFESGPSESDTESNVDSATDALLEIAVIPKDSFNAEAFDQQSVRKRSLYSTYASSAKISKTNDIKSISPEPWTASHKITKETASEQISTMSSSNPMINETRTICPSETQGLSVSEMLQSFVNTFE